MSIIRASRVSCQFTAARWKIRNDAAVTSVPRGQYEQAQGGVGRRVGESPDVVQPVAVSIEHAVAQQCENVGGGQGAGYAGQADRQRRDPRGDHPGGTLSSPAKLALPPDRVTMPRPAGLTRRAHSR